MGGTTAYAVTTRVDPDANVVANVYDDGAGDGFGASAMNGLIWFISDVEQGRITAVDAETGEHVRDLDVGVPIHHLTAGFGSLWVNPIGRPAVLRVDPETGDVPAEVALSGDSGYLTTSADAIWVAEPHQWLVGRIDPVADRVAAELQAAPGADHIAVAPDGLVWALTDDQLLAIDGAADQEVDRLSVPSPRRLRRHRDPRPGPRRGPGLVRGPGLARADPAHRLNARAALLPSTHKDGT